jgi:hypothetical protein
MQLCQSVQQPLLSCCLLALLLAWQCAQAHPALDRLLYVTRDSLESVECSYSVRRKRSQLQLNSAAARMS